MKPGNGVQFQDIDRMETDDVSAKLLSDTDITEHTEGTEWALLTFGITTAWALGALSTIMVNQFGKATNVLVQYGTEDVAVACLNATISTLLNNPTSLFDVIKAFASLNFSSHDYLSLLTRNNNMEHTDELFDGIKGIGIVLVVLGGVNLMLGYLMVTCLALSAERQLFRIRDVFLRSILRQDISWYDTQETGEFASRTTHDLIKLQDGIGEKIGMFNFNVATFSCCMVNAFVHSWKLTVVMLSITPVIMGTMAILVKIQTTSAEKQMKAYAKAGNVAEEALSAVRTVVAFGGEQKEVDRYNSNLYDADKQAIKQGLAASFSAAFLWFAIYAGYAFPFWYGIKLILDGVGKPEPELDVSSLVVVFVSIIVGSLQLGNSISYVEFLSEARAAAATIFNIIDRMPYIDSHSARGLKPDKMLGSIEFDGVVFEYPSRPNVRILDGLEMKVQKGETMALVGESGCGKSTAVQLLQRFYDPLEGNIKLDGCNIKLLNVGWLRKHIGVVGQEPVLFGTTIAENIRYGQETATRTEIESAAREANAHDFIMKLPKGYDTNVGDRGAQLSGGQKQRVAIARALIRNPRILILDEATSALDSESEALVQAALDKARQGRTTIIIAHRLSTIRNADKIAVLASGRVLEVGTHAQLMANEELYYQMVNTEARNGDNESATITTTVEEDENNQIASPMALISKTPPAAVTFRKPPSRSNKNNYTALKDEAEEMDVVQASSPMMKLLKCSEPEWIFNLLGCIGSFVFGFSTPVFSLIFGDILKDFSNCDLDETRRQSVHKSLIFIVIGVITGTSTFVKILMFNMAGNNLTRRLRKLLFAAMLRQEMSWHDNEQNNTGALCSRLSGDTETIKGGTGSCIGVMLQSICTVGASIIIALFLNWKLAAITAVFVPFMLLSSYLNMKFTMGQSDLEVESLDEANKIAMEAISNIRTVASLHNERLFHNSYVNILIGQHKRTIRKTHFRGITFGMSQAVQYFAHATCITYGSYLVFYQSLNYSVVFKISQLLIAGSRIAGDAFAFAPNYNNVMSAAARIFALLERRCGINSSSNDRVKLNENSSAFVEFKRIKFNYPSRPDTTIFRGLNLTVPPGKVTALVGTSGCGKSTCIQLMERFYEPVDGTITLNGKNISKLNVRWLRSQIGIVSQEPVLFDRTIAENIAYGDNSRQPSHEEIVQVAMTANAHRFITHLPLGYETRVGYRGTQLSGGQKQRIAIARALLRNPKILLLDEATSAMDTESEKVVQEALEQAQKGRTCIVVAHRLSTVRGADMIAVINQGKVVEIGSHDQLLARMGHYYKFYQTQTCGKQDT